MIRHISIVFFALLCLGCQGPIKFQDSPDGEYKEVQGSGFDVFVVRDQDVFKRYSGLFLLPLDLSAMEIHKETKPQIAKSWEPEEETRRMISDYYSGAKSLYYEEKRGRHSFGHINGPAQGVMAAEFRIKNFRPYVTRDGKDMANIVTESPAIGLGRLLLEITIVDAISGEFIAYILDSHHLTTDSIGTLDINKASQAYIWRSAFFTWFKELDRSIDRLKAIE